MISQIRNTADVVTAFESRVTDLDSTITVVDRLSMWDAAALRNADKAAFVEVAESSDSGGRGGQVVFARDTVRVSLLFKINPREQKISQAEALAVEETIRAGLLERAWGAPLDVTHVRTRRAPGRAPALGWYQIDIEVTTFRTLAGADPVLG